MTQEYLTAIIQTLITALIGGGLVTFISSRYKFQEKKEDSGTKLHELYIAGNESVIDNLRNEIIRLTDKVATMEEQVRKLREDNEKEKDKLRTYYEKEMTRLQDENHILRMELVDKDKIISELSKLKGNDKK